MFKINDTNELPDGSFPINKVKNNWPIKTEGSHTNNSV